LLVTSEDGEVYIGRQAKVTTKFEVEREILQNESNIGPIKDYKTRRYKP